MDKEKGDRLFDISIAVISTAMGAISLGLAITSGIFSKIADRTFYDGDSVLVDVRGGAWCDIRDCFTPENLSLAEEHAAVIETLDSFRELSLRGGVILIDGNIEAFTIGEPLNRETFVIHFEKANPRIIGLYQAINQEFCRTIADEYRFVNREQDLGEPGLRRAKESYCPDHLVEKYIVRIRE